MFTETIDITVQVLDSAGAPASAPLLFGIIRNSLGDIVQTLDLDDLEEVAVGSYQLLSYDVSDHVKFPGTELTIFWCTQSCDYTPAEALQTYRIYSPRAFAYAHRLLRWCPSFRKEGLYGYEVFRSLPSATPEPFNGTLYDDNLLLNLDVLNPSTPGVGFVPEQEGQTTSLIYESIGKTVYPYLFDLSEYPSESEFARTKYLVKELVWNRDYLEPFAANQTSMVDVVLSPYDYCKINGSFIDVSGDSSSQNLSFFIHDKDSPQKYGAANFQRRNEVPIHINRQGYFSAPLLQGALCTVECPDVGLNARFVVPYLPVVDFKDLDLYHFDTHRAY